MTKPTIGRIVHFIEHDGAKPVPAVITEVHSDTCVNLSVIPNQHHKSPYLVTSVTTYEGSQPRWMWPPREDPPEFVTSTEPPSAEDMQKIREQWRDAAAQPTDQEYAEKVAAAIEPAAPEHASEAVELPKD